jgi:putative membrane protein
MRTIFAATAALLLGASAALAQEATPTPAQPTTPAEEPAAVPAKVDTIAFVKAVPSANEFEIQSSKMAEQMATSEDVKSFAKQMIQDHTKAGEEFKIALSQGETTSSTTAAGASPLLPKEQAMLDELKAARGEAFDAKYIELQTNAHKEAVALFSNYAQSGDDPALKEFAKKTLPTLEQHYEHVQELASKKQG